MIQQKEDLGGSNVPSFPCMQLKSLALEESPMFTTVAAVTQALAVSLKNHAKLALVQQLWSRLTEQMSCCFDCIMAYERAVAAYPSSLDQEMLQQLLPVLFELDIARIQQFLGSVHAPGLDPLAPPVQAQMGVFEVLAFSNRLMADARAVAAVTAAIDKMKDVLVLEGPLPGIYQLLAHPEQWVRAWVSANKTTAAAIAAVGCSPRPSPMEGMKYLMPMSHLPE